jgi:23S rRNA (cytosine1962-C5)-methyltransferase
VYAGEIERVTGHVADGDAVDIRDFKDRFLGHGLLNRHSQITVRRFTTQKEDIDAAFLRRRIAAALAYRQQCGCRDAYRVVFSEADQLPGLIVDRYGDHVVLQALTLGIDRRKREIITILRELLSPSAVIERSDVVTRKLEGLEEAKGVLAGTSDGWVRLPLPEFSVDVNLLEDQKTGFFLDQRVNYAEVARFCAGKRVLDCFAYHGGFALAGAKAGAASVEAVEISEAAVARARKNAELNGLTGKIDFVCANAFDLLKKYDGEKRQFDVIVLDPPSFTRAKQNVGDALRGYKEISLRALKMLAQSGVLATFSCSHHINRELFMDVTLDAAADAKKTVRLLKTLTQSPDHPILPAIPETEYLKGFLLQVV